MVKSLPPRTEKLVMSGTKEETAGHVVDGHHVGLAFPNLLMEARMIHE